MGKNRKERIAGHDLFMKRVAERNRLDAEAGINFKGIDVRPVVQFILAADPIEAADRTMMKPQVLKNLSLGRFEPSNNQKQQILRAGKEMGWQPEVQ